MNSTEKMRERKYYKKPINRGLNMSEKLSKEVKVRKKYMSRLALLDEFVIGWDWENGELREAIYETEKERDKVYELINLAGNIEELNEMEDIFLNLYDYIEEGKDDIEEMKKFRQILEIEDFAIDKEQEVNKLIFKLKKLYYKKLYEYYDFKLQAN